MCVRDGLSHAAAHGSHSPSPSRPARARLHTSLPPARGRAPSAGCYPLTRAAAAVDPPHASSRHSAAYHPSRVAAAAVVHEQHGLGLEDLSLVHARDQRLETWGCRLGAWGCGSGYLGLQPRTRRRLRSPRRPLGHAALLLLPLLLLLLLPLLGAPATTTTLASRTSDILNHSSPRRT